MTSTKEKIYIFDLDHTLLNSLKFRQDIGLLLENNPEISSENIWSHFAAKDERLINFIKEKTKDYLFDDTLENLEKVKDKKVLLTFGSLEFQKLKVEALNFNEVFDQVFLTDENKMNFLESFISENSTKEIFFINDNNNKRFRENDEVRKLFPEVKVIDINNYDDEELGIPISQLFKDSFNKEKTAEIKNNFNNGFEKFK